MDPEVAVQLLSPSESVKYCARLDEPYYQKAFSKLMLKSTVDTLCDLYKSRRYGKACERIDGKQFDVPQKKRLDLSQFYGENKYSDGTDMELGD